MSTLRPHLFESKFERVRSLGPLAYKNGLPAGRAGPAAWGEAAWTDVPPDPLAEPALYDGVLWRRAAAYLVDVALIAVLSLCAWLVFGLAGILTLGALTPLGVVILAVRRSRPRRGA